MTTAPSIPPRRSLPDAASQLGMGAIGRARFKLWAWRVATQYGWFFLTLKVFATLALLGMLGKLPVLWHTLVVGAFAALALVSFWRATRNFKNISAQDARRAVERASGLAHRPLTSIDDQPATAAPLWARHRSNLAGQLRSVKLSVPKLQNLRLSYSQIRLASWAALILALIVAWDEAPRRLQQATQPAVEQLLPHAVLDVWVTPPEYSGQPPFALSLTQATASVPEGSTVNVRVTGGWLTPKATLPEGTTTLQQDGEGSYTLSLPVKTAGSFTVSQDWHTLGSWHFQLLLDTPPQVSFAKAPSKTDQQALRLDYTAIDDMGLARLVAVLEPVASPADASEPPLELEFALRTPAPLEANGFRYFDLTANPWSGSEVLITLVATDNKGQSASSETIAYTLPERRFTNPVAKALIKMRRELAAQGLAARKDLLLAIYGLSSEVEDNYVGDWIGALAINVIDSRLQYVTGAEGLPALSRLMWDTALHFEDGGNQQSLRHLREAQQRLEDAIAKGADPSELRQLMDELQQALREHLDNLQAQQQLPEQQAQDSEQNSQTITRDALEQYLEQMQQMLENGQTEQAQQMLKQLQELMENLQTAKPVQPDPQMQESLRELTEIEQQQREMMKQTEKSRQQGQGSGQNGEPQNTPMPTPDKQGELREWLGSVTEDLQGRGFETGEFEQAGEAMSRAQDKLGEPDAQGAAQAQREALEHLRQGMSNLQEQMAGGQQPRNSGSDPLGRDKGTGADTRKIEIPEQQEADRARKLLEELRKRAGEYDRPQDERNYLDRLLKMF